MNIEKEYRDGYVDIANKAILQETGVTSVGFPRLAKTAELIGTIASGCLYSCSVITLKNQETILPQPHNRRRIGYSILAIATVTTIAAINSGGL